MFLVNSRLGHFSATTSGSRREVLHPNVALLLPKLRSYFAEFLNRGYLARLRFLTLPTCVGLRYGHQHPSLEAFLVSVESTTSLLNFGRHHISGYCTGDFPPVLPTCLNRHQLSACLSSCVTPSSNGLLVALEFQPIVHRLRLSASP